MKGIVFTELIEMVETKWGLSVADKMLEPEGLSSEGIYTSVGTYDDKDIVILLQRLGAETNMGAGELQFHFGRYIFKSFATGYQEMLKDFHTTFALLSKLDDFIHPAVQKLYPDAELPGFEVLSRGDSQLIMNYSSNRKMPKFAEGLIYAAADHFEEKVQVAWQPNEKLDGNFIFEVNLLN